MRSLPQESALTASPEWYLVVLLLVRKWYLRPQSQPVTAQVAQAMIKGGQCLSGWLSSIQHLVGGRGVPDSRAQQGLERRHGGAASVEAEDRIRRRSGAGAWRRRRGGCRAARS